MPYNTRRKSLSLESLGIHVPVTHAARDAARASAHRHPTPTSDIEFSAASKHAAPDASPATAAHHPSKRTKRAHGADTKPFATPKHTPPPSPKPSRRDSVGMDDSDVGLPQMASLESEIDLDAVNDDIVEAVILQLKASDNRPHLVKELSAILMLQLKSVQQSANPCAIISSRLASYMKRPCWSSAAPCPLTKELENIHPRRTYYFLTTCPHQPLPDPSSSHFIVPRTSIVTPPLSTAPSGSEATEEERRRELSPSPEVDLSSPEWDDAEDEDFIPDTQAGPFSVRFSHPPIHYGGRNQRGASPPLEKDEKEFTQTAEGLQKRKLAGQMFTTTVTLSSPNGSIHPDEEVGREDSSLFGSESRHLEVSVSNGSNAFALLTSPAMRPAFGPGLKRDAESEGWANLDALLEWDRSPENVELDELDGLLDEF